MRPVSDIRACSVDGGNWFRHLASGGGSSCVSTSGPNQHSETIQRVLRYMEESYDQRISVSALADRAGLSKTHFSRLFRATVHMSPAAYLRRLRVRKAADRLRTSPASLVKQIAYESGFQSPSHFSRVFRDVTGASPSTQRL